MESLEDQSPCGRQLEVWARSYDVNFHCSFWKLFLKVRKCISFIEIYFFLPDLRKK